MFTASREVEKAISSRASPHSGNRLSSVQTKRGVCDIIIEAMKGFEGEAASSG